MSRRQSSSLVLIHGDDRFLVDEAVQQWRSGTQSLQLSVEVFDAPAQLGELRRSIGEVPLIDAERSVLLRDPPQLVTPLRRGADPPESLAALLHERAPSTSLCLAAHVRVAPSNPVLQAVRSLGGDIVYRTTPRGHELRAWFEDSAKKRGVRFAGGAADYVLQAVGPDLARLSTELDKMRAFSGGTPITAAEAREIVSHDDQSEMWAVLEQLLGRAPAEGAATLDRLLSEGRSTQHMLSVLSGQVRDLMLAQDHVRMRGTGAGLASELRIPEWRAQRLVRQANSAPPALVAGWLDALHDIDRRVKAGEVGDQDALRLLALRAADQLLSVRK